MARKAAVGAKKTEAKLTFEAALEELTGIVEGLESGDLGLDESLALFERGIRLSRVCSDRLTEAEQKLEKLVSDADGGLKAVQVEEEETGEDPGPESGPPPPPTHELPF